jgi:hypothetical protein
VTGAGLAATGVVVVSTAGVAFAVAGDMVGSFRDSGKVVVCLVGQGS